MDKQFGENLRKNFFTGLVVLFPLIITLYLLGLFINWADKILGVPISLIFFGGQRFPGIGLLISFIIIVLTGQFASALFFKKGFSWIEEKIFYRLPLVKNIYASAKQINDILFLQKYTGTFRRVCAVEYPRKGIYSIGFITNAAFSEIQKKSGQKLLNVFIPSTPTPATGFLIMVPEDEVVLIDLTLEEAIKLVVSGGVLSPSLKEIKNF